MCPIVGRRMALLFTWPRSGDSGRMYLSLDAIVVLCNDSFCDNSSRNARAASTRARNAAVSTNSEVVDWYKCYSIIGHLDFHTLCKPFLEI